MGNSFRSKAEVLIVGGGVAGVSVAYHLAKLGITDVLLCERKQLTCGTTWHAAGLVTQLRATRNMTELAKYTGELFKSLEAETGQATGFRQNGSLRLARTAERFLELKRGASMARNFGLPVEVIGPAEIKDRYPPIDTDGIVGGLWMERDGQVRASLRTIVTSSARRRRSTTSTALAASTRSACSPRAVSARRSRSGSATGKAFAFRDGCRAFGLKHIRTRPYTPKTNGKAERFIQSALREWAYARAYTHSDLRTAELPHWLHRYNWHRPHGSLKTKTPISRLGLSEDNLLRLHI